MAWMSQRKRLDLEVASDFVSMAAQLVFIKSRMLLSVHDEEALSEMEQLIASLEAHQRHENYLKVKAVTRELSDRYAIGRDYITKVPEHLPVSRTYRYVHSREDLRRAMAAVLERSDNKLPPPMSAFEGIVGREPYPVSDKAAELIQRLVHVGVTRFQALFRGSRSRSEVWPPSSPCWSSARPSASGWRARTPTAPSPAPGRRRALELSTDAY